MGKSKFNPVNIVQKTVAAVREKKDAVVNSAPANFVGKIASQSYRAPVAVVKNTSKAINDGGDFGDAFAGTLAGLKVDPVAGAVYDRVKTALSPGEIPGGAGNGMAPVPSEDPEAQRAATQAAEDERRPRGITSTVFAGLSDNQNGPKPKSARKTLLGY